MTFLQRPHRTDVAEIAIVQAVATSFLSNLAGTPLATSSRRTEMTMLRLTPRQRAVIVEKLPDLANVVIGVLVLGQFVGDEPASLSVITAGTAIWAGLTGVTLLIAGGDHD